MWRKNFWKRIMSFVFALTISLLAVNILWQENLTNKKQETIKSCKITSAGTGFAVDKAYSSKDFPVVKPSKIKPLQITSKPKAIYTDIARQNQVQGTVRLRLTFLASGQIGNIYPIKSLPDGLTEQAINTAMQIKFEPQTQNGKPISVTKVIEYSFTIY